MRPQLRLLALINLLLAGCASAPISGEEVSETRPLPAFETVEVSRGISVTLACGDQAKALLRGDASDLAGTEIAVNGSTLVVRRGSMRGKQ